MQLKKVKGALAPGWYFMQGDEGGFDGFAKG